MARTRSQLELTSEIEKTTVIDTDVHVTDGISHELLAEYLDEPHKSHLLNPTVSPFPVSGWNRGVGGKFEDQKLVNPKDVQKTLCEEFGVDYPILNATSTLTRLPQTDFATAAMTAYNDAMIDNYLEPYDDFYGLVTIATQKPEKAAEEINRIGGRDDIVGVYIATTGPQFPLGDERYDIIYHAAQENELTITFHGSGGGFQFDFNRQNQALETFFSAHTLAHPWSQMLTLVSLLENGTPEKFPELDFVFLESGLLWVPYMMYRMNKEYSMRRSELPLLEKSPEEYVRERMYFSTQPIGEPNDNTHVKKVIDLLGADSIVFSTDFPHWDFDHPGGVDKYLLSLESEEREQILNQNAANIFGIDI